MSKLTPKQELFCAYYAIKRNATQAAIDAGYSENTAKEIGSENLTKPHIKKRIDELLGVYSKEAESDGKETIQNFEKIARANILDYGKVEGNEFILHPSEEWTREQAYAVSEIRITKGKYGDHISFKLHDKVRALENLGRVHGIYEEDNSQSGIDKIVFKPSSKNDKGD